MHPVSSLLSCYKALVQGDLKDVEKWSSCLGVNNHFSNGMTILFVSNIDVSVNFTILSVFF